MARVGDDHATGTLIGLNGELGDPWHGEAHFLEAVPVDEAVKFLSFEVVEKAIFVVDVDSPLGFAEVPGKKAIVREDNGYVYQISTDRWVKHDYVAWLIEAVAEIVDASMGELEIGSVICLQQGQQACVQIRPPKGVTVGGDRVVPFLTAFSSMDSSLATGYKPARVRVVCRNTQAAAYGDKAFPMLKYKHTKNSKVRAEAAREVLGLVFQMEDAIAEEMDQMMHTSFGDDQFAQLMDVFRPVPEEDGRSKTIANKARGQLLTLWEYDMRVAPFRGTVWGATQAFNTFGHHYATVQNMDRDSRQALNLIKGETEKDDRLVLAAVGAIRDGDRTEDIRKAIGLDKEASSN